MQRFENILFVSEPEADDTPALERAAELAEHNQAGLTLVEVVEKLPAGLALPKSAVSVEALQSDLIRAAGERLGALAAPWRQRIRAQHKVLAGIPFLEIVREVLREGRDLVIKTAAPGGMLDRLFGSEDMHLLRKCPCPVWLARPSEPKPYQRILAAVDIEDVDDRQSADERLGLSRQIVEMASALAHSEAAELHVVNAWLAVGESALRSGRGMLPPLEVERYVEGIRLGHQRFLDNLSRHLAERVGRDTTVYVEPLKHLIKGAARDVIPDLVNDLRADLVVMGTVGRSGIPGFLIGNTAETILSRLNCSVLAVKPKGFVTPVRLESQDRA